VGVRKNTDDVVLASVHALETLHVEEKYLPLARHLLKVAAATAELQFRRPSDTSIHFRPREPLTIC